MSERRYWEFIKHKDVTILLIDLSGTSAEEKVAAIPEINHTMSLCSDGTLLVLEDLSNGHFNEASLEAVQRLWSFNKDKIIKIASIGVSPQQMIMKPMLEKMCGVEITCFEDKPAALDWLAEQKPRLSYMHEMSTTDSEQV